MRIAARTGATTQRADNTAPHDQDPTWRTVDPIGLVTVRDHVYLLATRAGKDRTYRLSRISAAEALPEPAQRTDRVDLDRAWRERSARFRSGGDQITVQVRVNPTRREELVGTALAVLAEEPDADGWLCLEVTFQDGRHAEWALWQLAMNAEALAPQWLRAALRDRAAAVTTRYDQRQNCVRNAPLPDQYDGIPDSSKSQ